MAGESPFTIIGNLTADPELRTTPSGAEVVNFTVASTPRTFDRQSNEWKDGETLFMRCAVWREVARNVEESLRKGNRVVVTGVLESKPFKTKEGENRTSIELKVEDIGASLKYATAKITKTTSGGGGGEGGGRSSRSNSGGGDDYDRGREERSSRRSPEEEDRGSRAPRDRSERAPRERAERGVRERSDVDDDY